MHKETTFDKFKPKFKKQLKQIYVYVEEKIDYACIVTDDLSLKKYKEVKTIHLIGKTSEHLKLIVSKENIHVISEDQNTETIYSSSIFYFELVDATKLDERVPDSQAMIKNSNVQYFFRSLGPIQDESEDENNNYESSPDDGFKLVTSKREIKKHLKEQNHKQVEPK